MNNGLCGAGAGYRRRIADDAQLPPTTAPPLPSPRPTPFVLWTVLVSALTWPGMQLVPLPGLDQSWIAALHMGAARHLAFGRDVVFTYGPLGFLSAPTLHFTPTALGAWLYGAAVHVAFVAALLIALRRWVRPAVAAVLAVAVLDLVLLEPGEQAVMVLFLFCGLLLQRDGAATRWERLAFALLGAAAGLQLLVKFNTGVTCVLLVAITALATPGGRRRLRAVVTSAAAFGVSITVLWVATGQAVAGFGDFIGRSGAITAGYTAAMAIEEPARHREYLWAAVAIAIVAVATWAATVGRRAARRIALATLVGSFVYLEFRRGFVRHDGHSWAFFSAALVAAVGFAWPRRRALTGVLCLLPCAAFLIGAIGPGTARDAAAPAARLRGLRSQITTLAVARHRHEHRALGVDAIRRAANLSPAVIDAVRGAVHVDPFDTAIVWAYGFRWDPTPIPQAYSAYTPSLDELNAGALSARHAPTTVLRPTHPGAVDGRHPMFESPAAMVALACHYTVVADDGNWQVLRSTSPRCGPARPAGRTTVRAGERVMVPPAPPGAMVVAHITLGAGTGSRIREALFKPVRPPRFVDANGSFRFVAATGPGPHIVRLPPTSRIASGEGDGTMNLDWFRIEGVEGHVRVQFETIAFGP